MRNPRAPIFLFFLCLLMVLVYYPTFGWLIERYLEPDSYYSHGFLIPLVTVFLIFSKRKEINKKENNQNFFGVLLVILSLGLHFIGILSEIFFLDGISIISLVYGMSFFLIGKRNTGKILFSITFLIFMIPIPLVAVNAISFPMKMIVTKSAVFVLDKIFNMPIRNEGFQIFFPKAILIVENPCSGLRSLISFIALGSLFAYFLKASWKKKIFLFFLSIPISLVSNFIRVILLSLGVYIYGNGIAKGFFHDFTGYFVFVLGFAFLWISWRCLNDRF